MFAEPEDRKPLVLIVDDNPRNIQLVGAILKNSIDCDCSFAMDGVQAQEQAAKMFPDLILLDVMMPMIDGYQTCEKLKADPVTAGIPIIFLTARVQADDIVRGFAAGAVDYVAKPFHAPELLARVRTQLAIKESSDTIQRQNDDRKQLLHVLCHDLANPFSSIVSCLDMIEDADSFLRLKKSLMEMAENGLSLIELVRQLRSLEEKGLPGIVETTLLRLLVDRSLILLEPRLKGKRIELDLQIDEGLKVKVEPVSFVNTVLNNLISNAVKFSLPESRIELIGRREGDVIAIRVIDHGVGMPEEILRDIFDLRKTTTRPGTENERGTGFGMPLVRRFVMASGGTIEVLSRDKQSAPERHGTEVIIRLPAV